MREIASKERRGVDGGREVRWRKMCARAEEKQSCKNAKRDKRKWRREVHGGEGDK